MRLVARQNTAMETAHWGRADAGPTGGGSDGAGREQGRLCWGSRLARARLWKLGGGGGGGGGGREEAFGIVTENEAPPPPFK